MNKIATIAVIAGLGMVMAAPVHAKRDPNINGTVKVGTLGLGVEVGVDWNKYLSSRLGVNYLSFSSSADVDDVHYDADPEWENVSLLMDLHPWQGLFRITGGMFYNGNEIELSGTPTERVNIGDDAYLPFQVGTISGTVEYGQWAPYAGVGWSSNRELKRGWGIGIDLGVMFQGSPEINDLSATGTMASDPGFQQNLEEEKQEILDEIKDYEYYPAVSVMATYKF